MEGFFSRAHYWVMLRNAAITRSSIGLVVAADMREISNHLQLSPHLLHVPPTHQRPTTSLTIAWSSERRCENGPEPTALRNLFLDLTLQLP
jgi:hypothetical protein